LLSQRLGPRHTLHVSLDGAPLPAPRLAASQVRFCRYRHSPTRELGYSGIRGAEG
jgi:hypothetical protein